MGVWVMIRFWVKIGKGKKNFYFGFDLACYQSQSVETSCKWYFRETVSLLLRRFLNTKFGTTSDELQTPIWVRL